jgi:hypothetical protein
LKNIKSTPEVYSREDPSIIWIAPDGSGKGRGSYDDPYTDATYGIGKAEPGSTVVFKAGRYFGDVTVQSGGSLQLPLSITVERAGDTVFDCGSWYLYDSSDLILSGFVFANTINSSLSVIGACERNCFRYLRFDGYAVLKDAGCNIFFGGSGSRCNVVEDCEFDAGPDVRHSVKKPVSIGILVSEGDTEDTDMLNRDYLFRRNIFSGYDCGILLGSRGIDGKQCGHIVEGNVFTGCAADGVRVKCGDVILRGNVFSACANSAVSVLMGYGSFVTDNRIEDCATGIRVLGAGHTIRNNCILRSSHQSVHVSLPEDEGIAPASNIIIENNTCVHGISPDVGPIGVRIDTGTSCVIRGNIFSGRGMSWEVFGTGDASKTSIYSGDNISAGACAPAQGCVAGAAGFINEKAGNYENASWHGAHGWMARGTEMENAADESERYASAVSAATDNGGMEPGQESSGDEEPILDRSYFFEQDDNEEDDGSAGYFFNEDE